MCEFQKDIMQWIQAGKDIALAQVIRAFGSSPRRPGALMAVNIEGQMTGSVSGGCIEGSVIQAALECIETGKRCVETYRTSYDGMETVSLGCGGNVDILISPLHTALFAAEYEEEKQGREYVRVTMLPGPQNAGNHLDFLMVKASREQEGLICTVMEKDGWYLLYPETMKSECGTMICVAQKIVEKMSHSPEPQNCNVSVPVTGTGEVTWEGYRYFYHRVMPKPKLICIGGVHISVHLTKMAKELGYQTIMIDPRGAFASEERFPYVDEIRKEWPQKAFATLHIDEMTAICALSHDPKFDVPALVAALKSPAFYIGCLGRTTTQWDRCQQLMEEGVTEEELTRIHGPIGLNLGGREPAEVALSIMSEITMERYGGSLPTRNMWDSGLRGKKEREERSRLS